MKESTLRVEGMTCHSCERRIEAALTKIPGVESARASQAGAKAVVRHEEGVGLEALRSAVEGAGYVVKAAPSRSTPVAIGVGIILAALYLMANSLGLFNNFPMADRSIGYGMLLVIGLLTSVHCVAMCGGIAISQSVKSAEVSGPGAGSLLARLRPGLLYNGGRVVSYTIVGGIVGGLGSIFNFSETAKGAITALAGFFMLWLGLKMLGIIPALPSSPGFLPAPLKRLVSGLSSKLRGRGPLVVGLLGGLMPCGPLQTMQLYALGTGSIGAGALSMFLFSIGTIPLMLVFGAAATVLPRRFVPAMVKASAVLVLLLGTLTLGRAAALAGISLPSPLAARGLSGLEGSLGNSALVQQAGYAPGQAAPLGSTGPGGQGPEAAAVPTAGSGDGIPRATVQNGVQTVVTVFGSNSYSPFYVQAGLPVRWIIKIRKEDLNGCNRTVVVPAYRIRKDLQPGDNVIEFTPTKTGVVPYSCWMGMIRSAFGVVEDLGKTNSGLETAPQGGTGAATASLDGGSGSVDLSDPTALSQALAIPGQGQGGCCGGGSFSGLDLEHIGIPTVKNGVQEITVKVDAKGYSPSAIVMQRGMKAVIHFEAVELDGCNDVVVFPDYNGSLDLSQGQLETPPIPVEGDFDFQCSMNMLHGHVRVVDNLATVNLAQIKKELASWTPPQGGGGCCGN